MSVLYLFVSHLPLVSPYPLSYSSCARKSPLQPLLFVSSRTPPLFLTYLPPVPADCPFSSVCPPSPFRSMSAVIPPAYMSVATLPVCVSAVTLLVCVGCHPSGLHVCCHPSHLCVAFTLLICVCCHHSDLHVTLPVCVLPSPFWSVSAVILPICMSAVTLPVCMSEVTLLVCCHPSQLRV